MSRLLAIVLLAVLVRFVGLSSLPPALNRDEAAIGYNAYSILKTAKDEHGQFLPLAFKSIGDYKMPLYIYATTIPVKLFGLNDFSIRFWSALSGVISVGLLYLVVKQLAPKAALTAALLLTFNPWAVFYSRIAFEANLALMLFLLGLYWLLKRQPLGLVVWLLSCLAYSASLIFIPLFSLLFFFKFRLKTRWLLAYLAVFSVIFISIWQVSSKKQSITVFSDPYLIDTYNQERTLKYQQNPLLAKLFYNQYIYFGRIVAKNYLQTFSPKFLSLKGDNHPWHQIPGVGNFYFLEIILSVIGMFKFKKNKLLLISWLLLAPLASAITIDAPHSTRALFLLPIILILASAGFQKAKKFLPLIAAIYFINIAYAGYQYLKIYPVKAAASLPVGLKEQLINFKNKPDQPMLYLTKVHDSTYLYPLVYLQIDPVLFQQTAVWTLPDTAGLTHAYKFANVIISD